jgi:hypothetical protein
MIPKFFDALCGGCWHNHYSFPITVRPCSRRNTAASVTGTYVVCLDCGKEFTYDWEEMKVITRPAKVPRGVHTGKFSRPHTFWSLALVLLTWCAIANAQMVAPTQRGKLPGETFVVGPAPSTPVTSEQTVSVDPPSKT